MANEDIKIIVGVLGDGSMSGESGKLIQQQLNSIAKQISSRDMPKIRVGVDFKATQEAFQRQLQNVVNSLKINAPVNLIANASKSAKSQATTAFSDFSGDTASVSNKAMSQKVALITQVDIAGKKYINTIQQQTEAEKKRAQAAKAADAEAAKASNDAIRASRERLQMDREIAAQEKKKISNEKAINAEVVATAKLNREKDQAIAKGELMLAQFPKMKKDRESFAKYNDIMSSVREGTITGKEANAQLNALSVSMKAAGLAGQTMGDKFKNAMSRFTQYVGASTIVLSLLRSVKQMVSNVVELDSAMVDLQIASGKSYEEVNKLIDSYHKLGQEMGATTIEVAKSADGWLRQGKTAAETEELIRDSMILSKLGQMESEDATKALTSATKGYGVAVKDTIGIVDKFTAVDMNAAVSAGYIATAMAETATSARLSGIEMDKLIGYISTIGEVTQDGAESVGNFLKTLTARMGNIKAGELIDPESSENLSDVEATLSGLDVKLRDTNSEFRNFGEVLDEVAGNWDSYSSVQQRALAVAFSGTRQQEKFLVLMDHYDEAMALASVSAESSGTALEKFGVVQDGVSARLGALKSAWQELSDTTVNSDFIKSAISGGTNILSVITQIVDKLGLIPMLTSGLSAVLGYNGIGVVGKNGKQKYALYLRAA